MGEEAGYITNSESIWKRRRSHTALPLRGDADGIRMRYDDMGAAGDAKQARSGIHR